MRHCTAFDLDLSGVNSLRHYIEVPLVAVEKVMNLIGQWIMTLQKILLKGMYSGPSLIRTPWDRGVVGYVKCSDN